MFTVPSDIDHLAGADPGPGGLFFWQAGSYSAPILIGTLTSDQVIGTLVSVSAVLAAVLICMHILILRQGRTDAFLTAAGLILTLTPLALGLLVALSSAYLLVSFDSGGDLPAIYTNLLQVTALTLLVWVAVQILAGFLTGLGVRKSGFK